MSRTKECTCMHKVSKKTKSCQNGCIRRLCDDRGNLPSVPSPTCHEQRNAHIAIAEQRKSLQQNRFHLNSYMARNVVCCVPGGGDKLGSSSHQTEKGSQQKRFHLTSYMVGNAVAAPRPAPNLGSSIREITRELTAKRFRSNKQT